MRTLRVGKEGNKSGGDGFKSKKKPVGDLESRRKKTSLAGTTKLAAVRRGVVFLDAA